MSSDPVQPERLSTLRPDPKQEAGSVALRDGDYVLYWMQASVRGSGNHALEHALWRANEARLPLLVVFGLTPSYPSANARHYQFLLEGLRDVRDTLKGRGVAFVIGLTSRDGPPEAALALAKGAALIVTDRGYLRTSRTWRQWLSENLEVQHQDLGLVQVEAEAVVPVHTASQKQEYAARTLRPKITRLLDHYLVPLEDSTPDHELKKAPQPKGTKWLELDELDDPAKLIQSFKVEGVAPVDTFIGGQGEARKRLKAFLKRLDGYDENRNDPLKDGSSQLSAYLHYGHISPVEIALAVREQGGSGVKPYLDELIVQRELSFNYCEFCEAYDEYRSLPQWAKDTLKEHQGDEREHTYTREELEAAATHDPYWNAAQQEMMQTGRMSNYLRMYWGKKVLEWTPDPEDAFRTLLALNDKYELDGRDPNSYANIAWVFGLHDRPWARRKIFGTVRYMAASGLERKFDIGEYAERWNGEAPEAKKSRKKSS